MALLDPSLMPLFLQSGLQGTPPYAPPLGFDQMSPHEIAAYRVRGGPPPNPQYVQSPDELMQSAIQTAPMLMPGVGGLASRAVAAAPKLMTGLGIGGILGLGTSEAGEPENADPEPTRPSEIQDAINAISSKVGPKRTQLDKLKANFEAKRISQQEYDRRRIPLEGEIGRADAEITKLDAPFQRQLTQWEERKNAGLLARQQADELLRRRQQEAGLPFRVKHPEATQNIVGAGAGLTGLTALATGLLSRGKLKPTLGVMGVGTAEGALTGNVPELLDLGGFQPLGSPEWQKTKDQMLSGNNLVRTGADALLHGGGAGAVSYLSSFGPKIVNHIKSYFGPGTTPPAPQTGLPGPQGAPMSPSLGLAGPPSPAGAGGINPSIPAQMPQSPPLMVQGKTGLWHYGAGSGKTGVVPKHLWPRTPTLMGP